MRTGTDSRLFERIEGELAVRYSPRGSDREYCTTTRNVSGGGVRMSLLKRLEPGTILDLEIFRYDSTIKTRCRGEVAWIWNEPMNKKTGQLFEAGIRFLDAELLYIGRLMACLGGQKNNILL